MGHCLVIKAVGLKNLYILMTARCGRPVIGWVIMIFQNMGHKASPVAGVDSRTPAPGSVTLA